MAESLHTVLSNKYVPKYPLAERSELSLKESQTTYKLSFGRSKRRESVVYQIDGYIITAGKKCDYLILAQQDVADTWKSIFVELKGTDVNHALEQLDASLSNPIFRHDSINEVHARIVAKSFPANTANSEFEKARRKFKTKYKSCSFKQVSSNQPDIIH